MRHTGLKVSVVIPVYNEEKYIGACLDSLMLQTELADEIIIVNNNSTDNTAAIVKKYPVRIISEKKQGMIPARNKGYNEAKYDIVARTDGDTILPRNWIKQIKQKFENDQDLVALSGPAKFYELRTKAALIIIYSTVVKQFLKHDCLYGPNYAFRTKAWEQIKNTVCEDDKEVHEDLDMAIHLAPLGKIKFFRNIVVSTSLRRWKKPEAYLEYLFRGLKSIQKHKQGITRQRSERFVKRLVSKALFFNKFQ